MGRIVNRSELAETFGVALSTVDQWVQQGMPCQARPERRGGTGYKIDLSAVLEWHRERERHNALGEMAKVDAEEARRRKIAAEAALAELELALKQGQVAPIGDLEKAWAAMVSAARAKLIGVGNKVGPIVASMAEAIECQAVIDTAVYEGLKELSGFEYDSEPESGNRESGPDLGAASETDGEPVGRPASPPKRRSKR